MKKKVVVKNLSKGKEEKLILEVKPIAVGAEIPSYAMASDVGFDLRANENVELFPGEQKKVRTGLVIKIPEGHVGLIRDRAGIVTKMNIHSVAGTFDPAYRGEVSIIMVNLSEETQMIEKGMRIAQMIVVPVIKPEIVKVNKIDKTERGERGFGSTGLKDRIREMKKIVKKLDKLNK